ncbi:MAG: RHS repeat-associated core domain-containing protein [Paracoccaceae bacterium]
MIRTYVWLGDMPVAVVEGGQVYLVRVDHIGRPVFATTLAGTQVWSAQYLPFGGVHVSTGTPMALRFPGQWFQMESGLHQNWMRDYDPTTGRYIEADPLGLIDGASVYGYARQNPGRYIDPTGEYVWTWPAIRLLLSYGARLVAPRLATAGAAALLSQGPIIDPDLPYFPDSMEGVELNYCRYCPPCFPYKKGTIGYREDNHPVNLPGVGVHHLNLYRVNQDPATCRCFWNANTPYHVNPPAQSDWVPLYSAGRGNRNTFPMVSPLDNIGPIVFD